MASTRVRSLVPLVCLKCSKSSVYHYITSRLSSKPGGDTGCLVSSYECLVKTFKNLLHSSSTLPQLFEHSEILLLLLREFLLVALMIINNKLLCLSRKIGTNLDKTEDASKNKNQGQDPHGCQFTRRLNSTVALSKF